MWKKVTEVFLQGFHVVQKEKQFQLSAQVHSLAGA